MSYYRFAGGGFHPLFLLFTGNDRPVETMIRTDLIYQRGLSVFLYLSSFDAFQMLTEAA